MPPFCTFIAFRMHPRHPYAPAGQPLLLLLMAISSNLIGAYQMYNLYDNNLCPANGKPIIKLGTHSKSALVISLGSTDYHDRRRDFSCRFRLTVSPTSYGIFAVVQNMKFAQANDSDECLDYVQYGKGDGTYSKKFCGSLNAATAGNLVLFAPDDRTRIADTPTMNSYIDNTGILDVYIFIRKENLMRPPGDVELEIVFTAYNHCQPPSNDHKPCGKVYVEPCIYDNFFFDGFVNCPFVDCVDEEGCPERHEVHIEEKKSLGNKVIIGSVSLLIVIFVLFVCFVWMCRRYKKLCWADEFSNPAVPVDASSSAPPYDVNSRTIEMNEPPVRGYIPTRAHITAGTAHGAATLEDDKDLPPSYESLFPQR